MSDKLRFDPGCRVIIRGQAYIDPRESDDGYTLTSERQRIDVNFTHETLQRERERGKLTYVPGATSGPLSAARQRGALSDKCKDSAKLKSRLDWRIKTLRAFLEMELAGQASRSKASVCVALERIQYKLICEASKEPVKTARGEVKPNAGTALEIRRKPSVRNFMRWLRRYESEGEIGLRPAFARCGNRKRRLPFEVVCLMKAGAEEYARETRLTVAKAYESTCRRIRSVNAERRQSGLEPLCIPSSKAFRRLLGDEPHFKVYAARHGLPAAIAKYYAARGGAPVKVPLERVEIDEAVVNLMTLVTDRRIFDALSPELKKAVERRRLWITVIIDCMTRYILSLVISPTPQPRAVIQALRLMLIDKTHIAQAYGCLSPWTGAGTPIELVADNGSSFVAQDVREICANLGIIYTHAPAGHPQQRAKIERFFGTLSQETVAAFAGRTFSNVVEKGDYPSADRAVLTEQELTEVLIRGAVDTYHNTQHRGLANETPANAWRRATEKYCVPPPPPRATVIAAFGEEFERMTSLRGVQFEDLWYQSPALQAHRQQFGDRAVSIRIDADDLSHIAVRLGGGWELASAVQHEEAATSLIERRANRAYVRKQRAAEADATIATRDAAKDRQDELLRRGAASAGITLLSGRDRSIEIAQQKVMMGFHEGEEDPFEVAKLFAEEISVGRPNYPDASRRPVISASRKNRSDRRDDDEWEIVG